MTRLSSLILLTAATLALASPALAKSTIQQGESLCKAEAQKVHAPKSIRIDKDETKATNQSFVFTLRVKSAENVASTISCKIDRETQAIALTLSE